ncbi:ABC transporter permease [Fundidesulfovibrio terrae]|uniref:ABC transporter permease n=1 Tax=Fundidesulfovibrio terrae TaxID=2922866 RepID=UPI001FAF6C59|nr:ABC transporter permease [Fundidesulfovibrio terrae]
MNDFAFLLTLTLKSSMAVLLAAQGEVLAERAGVINLGQEGLMLMGALTGFYVGFVTGSPVLAFAAAGAVGTLLSCLHGFFAIRLGANQLLSGIALTILGTGLSNYLGRGLIGKIGLRVQETPVPFLQDIPFVGPVLFKQNALVYVGIGVALVLWFLLTRTRLGLMVRACGENPAAADAMGTPVGRTRLLALSAGGFLSGMAGAYLSLVFTPGWKEGISGGQGWIAVAIVIFAGWRPMGALFGALFFGFLSALQFFFQATGAHFVPLYVLRILPYILTILTLSLAAALGRRGNAPAGLGKPYFRERA